LNRPEQRERTSGNRTGIACAGLLLSHTTCKMQLCAARLPFLSLTFVVRIAVRVTACVIPNCPLLTAVAIIVSVASGGWSNGTRHCNRTLSSWKDPTELPRKRASKHSAARTCLRRRKRSCPNRNCSGRCSMSAASRRSRRRNWYTVVQSVQTSAESSNR
jgi:hypothetical protein